MKIMTAIDLLMLIGAILYITVIVTSKSGPFDVFAKARMNNRVGGLLSCPWCAVIYIATVIVLLYVFLPTEYHPVLWIPGLAGLVMIVRSYSGVSHGG